MVQKNLGFLKQILLHKYFPTKNNKNKIARIIKITKMNNTKIK